MVSTRQDLDDAYQQFRDSLDKMHSMGEVILDDRDAQIAELKKKLDQQSPAKLKTVFGMNGLRTGKNGVKRTPDMRMYFQPGKFPMVPASAYLDSIEQEVTFSYKLPPKQVIAGTHDALILSHHRAARARLPKLVKGRRHRSVPWHEPASEIDSKQFTGDEHAGHVVHIAKLLHDNGLTDTFIVCPNYTMGPPKSGANFNTAWVPDIDEAPAGSLMISGDLYDNPYGGGALDSPYHDPHEDLNVLSKAANEHGYSRVAVLEVNAPRRKHDPSGIKRVEYLGNFVDALDDYPDLEFDVVDLWEGVGKWDQKFTLTNEWEFVARLLASSPQTKA